MVVVALSCVAESAVPLKIVTGAAQVTTGVALAITTMKALVDAVAPFASVAVMVNV
jgi:hypothetical protein